jgi:large subunit ribosomal protein L9
LDIQVILTGDDPKLGKRGQVVKVSAGYAQNYLFPHQKAKPATAGNLKDAEAEKARHAKEAAELLAQARGLAAKLQASKLRLEMPAGEGEKLFGAVTAQDIVDALAERGLRTDRKKIHLEEPIKKLGVHEVEFRLHPEVTAKVQLEVARKA